MKLKLKRETLLKPLQQVIGVIERKLSKPILANVLIDIKDNKISVTGTDLEVELIGRTAFNEPPDLKPLTLSGRKLIDICKALPENAAIELYQEKERVILKSGRSRFSLMTLPATDFPSITLKETLLQFPINQQQLRLLLHRTMFAMAQQDIRYYFNGMLLEVRENSLRAVATDSHRLALNIMDINLDRPRNNQIIVPRKGVTELMRFLEQDDSLVIITLGKRTVRVEGNSGVFTSKLIDGFFPDYERAIPKAGNKIALVDRDILKSALNRVAILCNEKFRGIRFEFAKNQLLISANNPEQEAGEDEITIEYTGSNIELAFNVDYLLDILNVINPGPICLAIIDTNSSMLIQENDANKNNSYFLVMPMRL